MENATKGKVYQAFYKASFVFYAKIPKKYVDDYYQQ